MEELQSYPYVKCEVTCLLCEEQPRFYVNFSKFHGLCSNHINIRDSSVCIHCSSTVQIFWQEEITCDICMQPTHVEIQYCNHRICSSCLTMSKKCRKCNPCCEKCRQFFEGSDNICYNCKFCVVCHKGKRDSDSDYCNKSYNCCSYCNQNKILSLCGSCNGMSCDACLINKIFCVTCNANLCKVCLSYSMETIKCLKHHYCYQCISKNNTCILCIDFKDSVCMGCNSVGKMKICEKGHWLCNKCYGLICKLCDNVCCKCSTSFPVGELSHFFCGHLCCEQCRADYNRPCMLCPRELKCYSCFALNKVARDDADSYIQCLKCRKSICVDCGYKRGMFCFRRHRCTNVM